MMAETLHRATLLCVLANGLLLDQAADDPLVQASAGLCLFLDELSALLLSFVATLPLNLRGRARHDCGAFTASSRVPGSGHDGREFSDKSGCWLNRQWPSPRPLCRTVMRRGSALYGCSQLPTGSAVHSGCCLRRKPAKRWVLCLDAEMLAFAASYGAVTCFCCCYTCQLCMGGFNAFAMQMQQPGTLIPILS